ncbi:hypothetical protein DPMN_057395 [Dreissena polymorpha]|uniref:Mitochondrial import inner membrane translocase subunit Tim21 n=2 Tax=Dreissena polymorpha TaxID=45954 RepID=A0A9D4BZW7_DREPO|nr:hypothetical protein DPMN_057395 [Dreissena polymorpha]
MRWTSNKSKTTDVDAQTEPPKTGKELDIKRKNPYADMTTGEKVKEAGKDITYVGFIVAGIVALGGLFYYIGSELFGGTSVNSVYSKAFKRCCNDPEVKVALGDPIRAFGEETSRRRRRHVSHMEYTQEGRQHMRMKFHIQGTDRQADVNVEVVKNDSGSYGYRYLFVQLKEFPYRTIILEDNR